MDNEEMINDKVDKIIEENIEDIKIWMDKYRICKTNLIVDIIIFSFSRIVSLLGIILKEYINSISIYLWFMLIASLFRNVLHSIKEIEKGKSELLEIFKSNNIDDVNSVGETCSDEYTETQQIHLFNMNKQKSLMDLFTLFTWLFFGAQNFIKHESFDLIDFMLMWIILMLSLYRSVVASKINLLGREVALLEYLQEMFENVNNMST